MARLTFLVFALIALGLWAYQVTMVSPLVADAGPDQAKRAVAGAAAPVALSLEAQRSLTQVVALQLAGKGAALWNAGPKAPAKPEAPSSERLSQVRTAVAEVVPPEQREALFIAVANEVGALSVTGEGEPEMKLPEGLDLSALSSTGSVATISGKRMLLFALPMAVSDKNEVRASGTVVVGLPVLALGKVLEQTQQALGLSSMAVLVEGKTIASVGDEASLAEASSALTAAGVAPVRSGPVRALGPLALPLFVEAPTHLIGSRQAIAGTPFEVLATASSKAPLDAAAGYQVFALAALAGLVLLSGVVLVLLRSPAEEGASMVLPAPLQPPSRKEPEAELAPATAPVPEASPDDFDFPPSAPAMAAANVPAPPFPGSAATGSTPAFSPEHEPDSDPFARAMPSGISASGLAATPSGLQARPSASGAGTSGVAAGHAPSAPSASATTGQSAALRETQPVQSASSAGHAATTSQVTVPRAAMASTRASAAPGADFDDEGPATVAYPNFKASQQSAPSGSGPVADPFAQAAQGETNPRAMMGHEDNPEATRVAAVPAELIKQAKAASTGERPAVVKSTGSNMPKVASVPPAAAVNDEEKHFQDVFRDFVATRDKCGEPADGLTYEKFKTKLLKNKEQLVAKYNCKSVRFQVYVKDGKAALKATPVKD